MEFVRVEYDVDAAGGPSGRARCRTTSPTISAQADGLTPARIPPSRTRRITNSEGPVSWLFPDERKFFEDFSGIATRLTTVATLLEQALDDPARLPNPSPRSIACNARRTRRPMTSMSTWTSC